MVIDSFAALTKRLLAGQLKGKVKPLPRPLPPPKQPKNGWGTGKKKQSKKQFNQAGDPNIGNSNGYRRFPPEERRTRLLAPVSCC